MNPITEFAVFEGKAYAATTRRMYLSAAKRALKLVGRMPENCGSYEELLALLRENKTRKKFPKALRIDPFLTFLDSKIAKHPENIPDYGPIRAWVLDRIEEETKATRTASQFIRRDLAMLACLCVEPGRGSPRHWPKTALTVCRQGGGFEVKLWGKPVKAEGLLLTLLYWHNWRERLDRPEQSRLHRKGWAHSGLLFPNSKGEAWTRHATRNALLRLSVQGVAPFRLTPGLIRQAFLELPA
jgi:hypothetical protein